MRAQASALLLALCCLWAAEGQSENNKKSSWEDPIQFSTRAKDACSMVVTGQGEVTKLRISCRNQNKTYWCEYVGKPQTCRSYNNNPRHYYTQIMWDLRKLSSACEGPRALKPLMCKRAADEAQMVFTNAWPKPAAQKPVKTGQEKPPPQARAETPKTGTPKPVTSKPVTLKPAQAKPVQAKPEPAKPEPGKVEPAKPAPAKQVPAKPASVQPVPAKVHPAQPESAKTAVKVNPPKKALPRPPKTTPARPTESTTKGDVKQMAEDYCWQSLQGICSYVIGWFHN